MFEVRFRRLDDSKTEITIKPKLGKIRQMLRRKGFSDVQAEIVVQLYALNPLFIHAYDVKAVMNIRRNGMEGVRLHIRLHRVTNIDILYDRGSDLYIVEGYTFKGVEPVRVRRYDMVFWDELDNVIRKILSYPYEP